MKIKLSLLFLMGLVPLFMISQELVKSENFDNGGVKMTILQDGASIIVSNYFENGQIKDQSTFVGTVKNGDFKAWYQDGRTKLMASYTDNHPAGTWTMWNENGEKIGLASFKNGKLEAGTMWNDDGKMMANR